MVWMGWRKLSVAIPASLISDTPHLREKTGKLGLVARACSIFRASEIVIYADDPRRDQKDDIELCTQILRFVETPQYLRKRIFRLTSNLRYTGILPPLQTPPHNVPHSIRECKVGDRREGVIVDGRGGNLLVDVGLEKALEVPGDYPVGRRVTARITKIATNLVGEVVDEMTPNAPELSGSEVYWGYQVTNADSPLGKFVRSQDFDLKIGTSRYGSPVGSVWPHLTASLNTAKQMMIAFGSPKIGLKEILAQESDIPEDVFDYYLNTVPEQGASTVRTEEAILISLGILNFATSIY
jgi:predicted SPOUT superfamily RNA methylase MTH1